MSEPLSFIKLSLYTDSPSQLLLCNSFNLFNTIISIYQSSLLIANVFFDFVNIIVLSKSNDAILTILSITLLLVKTLIIQYNNNFINQFFK